MQDASNIIQMGQYIYNNTASTVYHMKTVQYTKNIYFQLFYLINRIHINTK